MGRGMSKDYRPALLAMEDGSVFLCRSFTGHGHDGLSGLDTRAVTLRIREAGAMRAKLSTLETDGQILVEQARRCPVSTSTTAQSKVSVMNDIRFYLSSIIRKPGRAEGCDASVFRIS